MIGGTMDFVSMWPKNYEIEIPPRILPLGVYICYFQGDERELQHLLDFLYTHFALSEKDFGKNIDVDEERFPLTWAERKSISFKRLIKNIDRGDRIVKQVDIGFRHGHQFLFRAYKAHVDHDASVGKGMKEFLAEIEYEYFGTPSDIN